MSAQCSPHWKWLSTRIAAVVVAHISIATASEMVQPRTIMQTHQLEDECVALSNAMALRKLGISVHGHTLAQRRITKRLGREFEAAHQTLPDAIAEEVISHVILNTSAKVTPSVLRDLTSRGALVLSLSTKRLLGDRSGRAIPDHAVHIREIVRKHGVDYMVVENCWGRGWASDGVGYVPVSALRELPYVYGLFLHKRGAQGVSISTSNVVTARPFRISYASGRSYPQPASKNPSPRTYRKKSHEVNSFIDKLLASR